MAGRRGLPSRRRMGSKVAQDPHEYLESGLGGFDGWEVEACYQGAESAH
jgi:hypothetical protein